MRRICLPIATMHSTQSDVFTATIAVFASVGDRIIVPLADNMESSQVLYLGDAATVSDMLDACKKERDSSNVQVPALPSCLCLFPINAPC